MAAVPGELSLPLTGERTLPDLDQEHYWFTRHVAAYQWAVQLCRGTVLDAGAGEGYGAALLADVADLAIAMDLDHQSSASAMRRYRRIQAITGNLWSWPLAPMSVDVVISLQVIEHLWEPVALLTEADRCLRPGGLLIVSTPNRLTFSPGLARGERPLNPFHVQEFDGEQLVHMLTEHGFRDITLTAVLDGLGMHLDQTLIRQPDPSTWSTDLWARVRRTSIADFPIAEMSLADFTVESDRDARVLDLIVTARPADVSDRDLPG
jgi:SAM-dependent methyltransferase